MVGGASLVPCGVDQFGHFCGKTPLRRINVLDIPTTCSRYSRGTGTMYYKNDPPYQIQYIVPVPLEYRLQVVGISSTFILRKGVFPQQSPNRSTPQGTKEAPPTVKTYEGVAQKGLKMLFPVSDERYRSTDAYLGRCR